MEYKFIKSDFIPAGTKVDAEDYEGGNPDNMPLLIKTEPQPHTTATPTTHPSILQAQPPLRDVTNMLRIKLPLPNIASAIGRIIQGTGFRLSIAATRLPTIQEAADDADESEKEREVSDEVEDDGTSGRRTFCPLLYREPIINMMERHYCAHPSIPGSSPPDATLIKKWAVQRMYDFCVRHELPEVWVYLWENWYRKGRWELWARCAHKLIPVLKTTMIVESQ
jgi:hypothetical protein